MIYTQAMQSIDTRGNGASKLEIEARQKLQNFSTNDVTHQNR